jgi:hypothetical protein
VFRGAGVVGVAPAHRRPVEVRAPHSCVVCVVHILVVTRADHTWVRVRVRVRIRVRVRVRVRFCVVHILVVARADHTWVRVRVRVRIRVRVRVRVRDLY